MKDAGPGSAMRMGVSGQFSGVRASERSSWPTLYNPRRMRCTQEVTLVVSADRLLVTRRDVDSSRSRAKSRYGPLAGGSWLMGRARSRAFCTAVSGADSPAARRGVTRGMVSPGSACGIITL
jgi:hypothetical protein